MKGYSRMHFEDHEAVQPPSVEEARSAFLRLAEATAE